MTDTMDLRRFYFQNATDRDAALLRIRNEDYSDSTADMIRDYQESLLAHSQANHRQVREAISRLERLAKAEAVLVSAGATLDGIPVTSMSQLEAKYEKSRNDHRITKIIKTPA